jgi:hypothetical protein
MVAGRTWSASICDHPPYTATLGAAIVWRSAQTHVLDAGYDPLAPQPTKCPLDRDVLRFTNEAIAVSIARDLIYVAPNGERGRLPSIGLTSPYGLKSRALHPAHSSTHLSVPQVNI